MQINNFLPNYHTTIEHYLFKFVTFALHSHINWTFSALIGKKQRVRNHCEPILKKNNLSNYYHTFPKG